MRLPFLYDYQKEAVEKMRDGCILCGGVGSGKSRTSLYYYFTSQGGEIEDRTYKAMKDPIDLYVITTAKKRDSAEWQVDMAPFLISPTKDATPYTNTVIIDSWNNISKYKNVKNSFFIFDEQRVVGKGKWVETFIKITKSNRWILLSATPGDTWSDYIPVFIANGFYKNRTEFNRKHIVYSPFTDYPKIDRYLNTGRLIRLRNRILVDMDFDRKTVRHNIDIWCNYDHIRYKNAGKDRWNPYTEEPIKNAAELCYVWRRIVNTDPNRQVKILDIFDEHPRLIIFYNFDYELEILKELFNGYVSDDSERRDEAKHDADAAGATVPSRKYFDIAEWNGHKHQPIPETTSWVYLVQYTAGCEGWNCIKTDTIVFYSQNYSYKVMEQASGRIDRLNTPYTDLYFYHLKSKSGIDLEIGKALKQKKKFNERRFVGYQFQ